MEWAWAGAGDSPRGRAEPGPGWYRRLCRHARLPLSCEGRVEGRPGCGAGRWVGCGGGGELVRRAGKLVRRTGGPSPRVLPVVVARRRHLASACHRGAVRTQLVGGSPPWVRVVWCHPCAAGRIAIVWLVVEWPSRHWPCVAVPGGRQWWPARGSVPMAGMGGDRRGRTVARACRQSAGRARSPAIPPRHAGRAPPRALCAPGGQVCLGSLPRAQSPTHTAVRRFARRAAAAPRRASPWP